MNREELRDQIAEKIRMRLGSQLELFPHAAEFLADGVLEIVWPEIERLRSWDGLMEVLDEHYPADAFVGSSGDKGPRIIALTREVDRLLKLTKTDGPRP